MEKISFHLVPASMKPEKSTQLEEAVNISLERCAAYLALWHGERHWSDAQIVRCQEIFQLLVRQVTHVELFDDGMHFGYDDFNPPGHFEEKRSNVEKCLFRAPQIVVPCFNLDQQDRLSSTPTHSLEQLLTEENAYVDFQSFWASLPDYQRPSDLQK